MYLTKSFLCLGLLILFGINIKAQDDPVRIGFGVGFGQGFNFFGGEELSVITLPIDFADFSVVVRGKNFRFEPTLGYFSSSSSSSSSGYTYESSSSNLRLGTILAYATAISSMNLYYGIDIGVILSSEKRESTFPGSTSTDRSKTDFYIGPAIGGEYMFSDNFSLGGEIQINYISIGNFDDDSDASSSAVSSRGKIMLRWYVN
ncbi:outer membrane beta-barrel protein [Bacteroidota bacterium]